MELKTQADHIKNLPRQSEEGPSNLESYCTVATGNHGYEAALLMNSIRLHSDKKIYLLTDAFGHQCLEEDIPDNVEVTVIPDGFLEERRSEFPENLGDIWPDCASWGSLWNPAEGSLKMDIMSKAIKGSGNTLFLDADVIMVNPVTCNFQHPVSLSPHLITEEACQAYGIYNAGYVYSSDPSFPEFWANAFRSDSKFLEQECLGRIYKQYDTSLFSEAHNYGLWKSSFSNIDSNKDQLLAELGMSAGDDIYLNKERMVSFHAHLKPKEAQRHISYNLVRVFYECLIRSSKECHNKLMNFISDVFLPKATMLRLGEPYPVTV